jgi:hypothetical protein
MSAAASVSPEDRICQTCSQCDRCKRRNCISGRSPLRPPRAAWMGLSLPKSFGALCPCIVVAILVLFRDHLMRNLECHGLIAGQRLPGLGDRQGVQCRGKQSMSLLWEFVFGIDTLIWRAKCLSELGCDPIRVILDSAGPCIPFLWLMNETCLSCARSMKATAGCIMKVTSFMFSEEKL